MSKGSRYHGTKFLLIEGLPRLQTWWESEVSLWIGGVSFHRILVINHRPTQITMTARPASLVHTQLNVLPLFGSFVRSQVEIHYLEECQILGMGRCDFE